MADWNRPTLTDLYTDVLTTHLAGKDVDAVTLISNTAIVSNLPVGAMRYDRTNDLFAEWNGTSFVTAPIGIAGGGTGASTAATARTNLGLGSMATQNANAVAITGGSISGVSLDAAAIGSGVIALARGGTSASLGLGAANSFLQSTGSSVVFGTNGSALTNLNGSNITAGVVPIANLPPYPVVPAPTPPVIQNLRQIRQVIANAQTYCGTVNAWVACTGFNTSFQPIYGDSKVLIRYIMGTYGTIANVGHQIGIDYKLERNGVLVGQWNAQMLIAGAGANNITWQIIPIEFLDSPATTAAVSYQLFIRFTYRQGNTGGPVGVHYFANAQYSSATFEEVAP